MPRFLQSMVVDAFIPKLPPMNCQWPREASIHGPAMLVVPVDKISCKLLNLVRNYLARSKTCADLIRWWCSGLPLILQNGVRARKCRINPINTRVLLSPESESLPTFSWRFDLYSPCTVNPRYKQLLRTGKKLLITRQKLGNVQARPKRPSNSSLNAMPCRPSISRFSWYRTTSTCSLFRKLTWGWSWYVCLGSIMCWVRSSSRSLSVHVCRAWISFDGMIMRFTLVNFSLTYWGISTY